MALPCILEQRNPLMHGLQIRRYQIRILPRHLQRGMPEDLPQRAKSADTS
jgi:hypothetical protein